jgi:hypothetical protein
VRPDIARSDHLRSFFGVVRNELCETGNRQRKWRVGKFGEPSASNVYFSSDDVVCLE